MGLPTFAIAILAAGLIIAAAVWTIGARVRHSHGEPAVASFAAMLLRGLFLPIALILMAADFTSSVTTWMVWSGLVLGTWLATLIVVRSVLGVVLGSQDFSRATEAPIVTPVSLVQPQVEAARA